MTFRQFVILMSVATASLWLGWWWTVISIDPSATNWLGFLLFYVSLFLSLIGTFTLLGVFLRKMKMHDAVIFQLVLLSARQSILLSSLFVVLLLLQAQRILNIWITLILVIGVFLLEFSILYKDHKNKRFYSRPLEDPKSNDSVPPIFEKKEIEQ
jgi:hypothetical protein